MTDDEINRAVATELGWMLHAHFTRWLKSGCHSITVALPDFCADYNAAAEMRQFVMQQPCIDRYFTELAAVLRSVQYSLSRAEVWAVMNATPREQAEAFLRMREKWVEGKV